MQSVLGIGYELILNAIPERSRVLDLGCGNGALLQRLQNEKRVTGYGVEISEENVSQCIERGVYCHQSDVDEGLSDYKDNSFDFVVINQTLQSTKRPDFVLQEILRICKNTIVSFPNFGYYLTRLQLLFRGTMPKSRLLPYEWYESPNIHLLTIKDFNFLCRRKGYRIQNEMHFSINDRGETAYRTCVPNLRAQFGFFVLNGENVTSESLGRNQNGAA